MNAPLDVRIESLSNRLDESIRNGLRTQLHTLRHSDNSIGVLCTVSRLFLQLLRLVYNKIGVAPPSDNLFHCLAHLSAGDADTKIRGLNVLPREIASQSHTARILSNAADHAFELTQLRPADAETALGLYLRLVEWYYTEFDKGERLASIYQAGRAKRRWLRGWRGIVTAAGLSVAVLTALASAWMLLHRSGDPRSGTEPTLGDVTNRLGGGTATVGPSAGTPEDLGDLLRTGIPPPGAGLSPRVILNVLKNAGRKQFTEIRDGDTLWSDKDEYVIVVRPATNGYLYLFQIDSLGKVNWYFPRNDDPESAGDNPVKAGETISIPPAGSDRGLYLDAHRGKEHIYAVLSACRWPTLEKHLAKARTAGQAVAPLGRNRGAKGSRPLTEAIDLGWGAFTLRVQGEEVIGEKSFLIVERWFHHD